MKNAETLRFVILADTHFITPERSKAEWEKYGGQKGWEWWNRCLLLRAPEIGAAIVETVSALKPDFVLHCGDLTEDSARESFELGCSILGKLPCPTYIAVGNHDNPADLVRHYQLPAERSYYSREIGGLLVCVLDTCYYQYADGTTSSNYDESRPGARYVVPPHEMDWLRQELEHHADMPTVLVSHLAFAFKPAYRKTKYPDTRPLLQPPEDELRAGLFPRMLSNYREVRALLKHHPQVKLALCGHWHLNDYLVEDGVGFCQTCGMNEYPFEFRLAEIKNGVLSMTTHGLNNPAFARESLITPPLISRGLPIEPPGDNAWVAGEPADRTFNIDLCGR